MKRTLLFLLVTTILSCKDDTCKQFQKNYTPKNLDEVFLYFDCNWSDKMKEDFKNKAEDELAMLHHGFGTSLRNNWKLWKAQNDLSKYFNKIGIYHPDDMSSIIIKSYHKKLNRKPINLEKQISSYKDYWKKMKEQQQDEELDDNTDF